MKRIFPLCLLPNGKEMKNLHGKKRRKKRRNLRKAIERLRSIIKNKAMSARKGRKIHTKTVRGMLYWSHYNFRQRLIAKSDLFSDCKVIECDESYTSTGKPLKDYEAMSARKGRKIHTKTVRGMLCWSHNNFRQRLIAKSELFSDCKVIECDESYTSKTCGHGLHLWFEFATWSLQSDEITPSTISYENLLNTFDKKC
eukprot:Pgem_evm2s10088